MHYHYNCFDQQVLFANDVNGQDVTGGMHQTLNGDTIK